MAKYPRATRLSIYTLIDSMMKKQRKGMLQEDDAKDSAKETRQAVHRRICKFNGRRERSAQSHVMFLNPESHPRRV